VKRLDQLDLPFYIVILIMTFEACSLKNNEPQMAFYYWKSDFSWSIEDSLKADSLKLKNIYVKLFDVKYIPSNPELAMPAATLQFAQQFPKNLSLTPVVYIENEVFKTADPSSLAAKVYNRMDEMLKAFAARPIKEFQIDCDWTIKTQEAYFQFLNTFKSKLSANTKLSATIRLHQIKYADKTGVPPVDKGLLMYYNMTDIRQQNTENSILDNQQALKYLRNKKPYPLPLDFALPIFEWSVLFKEGNIATILNDINQRNIHKLDFLQKQTQNHYLCVKDTLWHRNFLRKGDKIRHEFVTPEQLILAAQICSEALNQTQPNIIFFHWDKQILQHHDNTIFEKTIACFR
jgi:hypothetical protein